MERTREMHVAERERRLAILNRLMEENDLAAMVCHGNGAMAYQADVKYMTDLMTPCGHIFSMMVRGEQPIALLGRADAGFHARLKTFLDADHVVITPDMVGEICRRIEDLPGDHPRVGVPTLEESPKFFADALYRTKAEIVDITDAFVVAKAPKAPYELQLLQETSDLAVAAFEEVVKYIRPGMTEKEVVGFAEGYLRAHGAEDLLILSRGEYPHAFINRPTFRRIEKDDLFVFSVEIAGIYGYWTQIIRPIFLSKESNREAYEVLCQEKEAIQAGVESFRPGNRICDVAAAINRVAQKYELSKGVWAGHSMGIDLGDGYNIGESNKMEIVPDMILTFHPSLLNKNGEGVLYADTYVSTTGEARCLTDKYRESPYLEDLKKLVK